MESIQPIARRRAQRVGWSRQEDEYLWKEAARSRENGLPLKCVFEQVARQTGRKANSIRNYYYAQVRLKKASGTGEPDRLPEVNAFVPFSDAEVREMLCHVLTAQARGKSVRACTLELGKGDNKAMLRYQNKYRSVVRNDPDLVAEVMEELRRQGVPYVDPYQRKPRRHRELSDAPSELERLGARVARALESVSRGAAVDILRSLQALADAADARREINGGEEAKVCAQAGENVQTLRRQCDELRCMLRQLLHINQEFLSGQAADSEGDPGEAALSERVREIDSQLRELENICS